MMFDFPLPFGPTTAENRWVSGVSRYAIRDFQRYLMQRPNLALASVGFEILQHHLGDDETACIRDYVRLVNGCGFRHSRGQRSGRGRLHLNGVAKHEERRESRGRRTTANWLRETGGKSSPQRNSPIFPNRSPIFPKRSPKFAFLRGTVRCRAPQRNSVNYVPRSC